MRAHSTSARTVLALALLGCLPSCSFLYPEQDPEEIRPKNNGKPQFEPEYYSLNAKQYFEVGRYAQAKEQWKYQLQLEADNWMAKLGVANCDYEMGSIALDRGDLKTSRELMTNSEAQLREIWDGSIEPSTEGTSHAPRPQWKAALVLARVHRGLGDVARQQSLLLGQRMQGMKSNDEARLAAAEEKMKLEAQSAENHKSALALLEKLSAMELPSEVAILYAAELHASAGEIERSEKEFLEYLRIADRSRKNLNALREQIEKNSEDPRQRDSDLRAIDEKLASNAAKQAAVLDRLGALHFDRAQVASAIAKNGGESAGRRRASEQEASRHYGEAVQHLRRAREINPDRLDLLVKLAQCQAELGLYEAAITNLDAYIAGCSERNDRFNPDLSRAFRLRQEYDDRSKEGRKR